MSQQFVHLQKERARALPDKRIIWQSWNACTQLYTLSKHAHKQWVIHWTPSGHSSKGDGVTVPRPRRRQPTRCPSMITKLRLLRTGKTRQSQNYQHLYKSLFRIRRLNTVTEASSCLAREEGPWSLAEPHHENTTAAQSSCHDGSKDTGAAALDPTGTSREESWGILRLHGDTQRRPWALGMAWSTDGTNISTRRP